MAKDRSEILFEEIKSDVKAIAEGQTVIINKIDRLDEKFTREISDVKSALKFVADKVENIDNKLEAHIKQPSQV